MSEYVNKPDVDEWAQPNLVFYFTQKRDGSIWLSSEAFTHDIEWYPEWHCLMVEACTVRGEEFLMLASDPDVIAKMSCLVGERTFAKWRRQFVAERGEDFRSWVDRYR